ncbi:ABC transporter substrate-binding protein [Fusibacter bizertensis]
MFKRFLPLILAIILLTSCTNKNAVPYTTIEDVTITSSSDSQPITDMPIDASTSTYVDGVGREITLPNDIDSISALYTVVGHIVIMLDHGEMITSCSKGLKRDKLVLNMVPEIENIYMPKNSGEINIEELLRSSPDVIFIDAATYWDKSLMETIDKLNIPYYVVSFNSIEEEIKLVSDVAKMVNNVEEGKQYIDFYNQALMTAENIVSKIPMEDRLTVYHAVNEAVRTSPANTLPAEWLEKAGCLNVALGKDVSKNEDKYYTTLEDILLWNPQVILTNEPDTFNYIKDMKAWQTMDAVKNNRLYLLPTGVSRWGHATSLETPLAMLWTIKTLYPKYADAIDIATITKSFYKDLFEYDLTDDEIAQILSGYDMRKAKNLE